MQKLADTIKKSDIKTILIPAGEIEKSGILKKDNLLGIVEFNNGKNIFNNKINKEIPYLSVRLPCFLTEPYLEVWQSESPVSYGITGNLCFATDGENLFGTVSFPENNCNLTELSKNIYDKIFNAIFELGYPYLYRIWNYIPHINNDDNTGLDHYKAFCCGRAASFNDNNYLNKSKRFPASTGIGSLSGNTSVCFLASSFPDCINLENSMQTPAYEYPTQSNSKPPSFARATYYKRDNGRFNIFVSGTASIIGHKSIHIDAPEKQCITTLKNIETLISANNLKKYNIDGDFTLKDLDCIKVYVRNESDFGMIKDICEQNFSQDASIVYLQADICRSELLVEIEGIVQKF